MKHITCTDDIDRLVDNFEHYLREVKGLVPKTCARCTSRAHKFLTEAWKRAAHDLMLGDLRSQEILRYVTRQRARCKPWSLQELGSTLRTLLRFLVMTGEVADSLIHAVPKISRGPRVGSPYYLTEAQLQTLLASVDPRSPEGARDQALILVLAQAGLRAGEAAHLLLDDLDWSGGTLRVTQTKGRRERRLPFSAALTKALAHYLRRARPVTAHRRVFVGFPDHRPLSSQRVSEVIGAVLRRARLVFPRPGAHLLRHTFATHLAQRGAGPKAIADLLGHRQLQTAGFYIQVNLPLLQTVAQPWPEGGV